MDFCRNCQLDTSNNCWTTLRIELEIKWGVKMENNISKEDKFKEINKDTVEIIITRYIAFQRAMQRTRRTLSSNFHGKQKLVNSS